MLGYACGFRAKDFRFGLMVTVGLGGLGFVEHGFDGHRFLGLDRCADSRSCGQGSGGLGHLYSGGLVSGWWDILLVFQIQARMLECLFLGNLLERKCSIVLLWRRHDVVFRCFGSGGLLCEHGFELLPLRTDGPGLMIEGRGAV